LREYQYVLINAFSGLGRRTQLAKEAPRVWMVPISL
jgi:hypothetical protein